MTHSAILTEEQKKVRFRKALQKRQQEVVGKYSITHFTTCNHLTQRFPTWGYVRNLEGYANFHYFKTVNEKKQK